MKRRVLLWLCLILILGGLITAGYLTWHNKWLQNLWNARPTYTKTAPGFYRVTYVYDGDTIQVDMDGALEKVRFIGVDTPETHDPDVDVQCYGREASNFTTNLLLDKSVRLESDETNSNRDRYDRLLRYVYSEDNVLINKYLIENGYGFAYTRFPFIQKTEFLNAETASKSQNLGLWSMCGQEVVGGIYQTTMR